MKPPCGRKNKFRTAGLHIDILMNLEDKYEKTLFYSIVIIYHDLQLATDERAGGR